MLLTRTSTPRAPRFEPRSLARTARSRAVNTCGTCFPERAWNHVRGTWIWLIFAAVASVILGFLLLFFLANENAANVVVRFEEHKGTKSKAAKTTKDQTMPGLTPNSSEEMTDTSTTVTFAESTEEVTTAEVTSPPQGPKTVVTVTRTTVATVPTTTQIPQTPTTVSSTVSTAATVPTTTPASTTPIPKVTLPLLCVTGNTSVGARVPNDGICTYLVFSKVRAMTQKHVPGLLAGDNILKGNETMHRFMKAVSGLKKTALMLAINLQHWDETIEVLKQSDVLGPYIRQGVKGLGFPDYKSELNEYKAGSFLEHKLGILQDLLHSQKHKGVILFAGLLLTTQSQPDAAARIVNHSISLLRYVSLYIVYAHSPRQDDYGTGCVRRPMSSFRTSTLGDQSLQSVNAAIDIVKKLGARNATYFISLTMGIHRFLPRKGWVEDVNKLRSLGCTMHFDPYEEVCKNPLVEGSVAEYKDDAIHYDYDEKARIWRTYDTLDTIRKKIKRAYKELAGLPFGWAAFYIEMDDWNGTCPNSTKNKPQRLLELVKPLNKQLQSG